MPLARAPLAVVVIHGQLLDRAVLFAAEGVLSPDVATSLRSVLTQSGVSTKEMKCPAPCQLNVPYWGTRATGLPDCEPW